MYVVRGNCDWSGDYPQERIVEFGGERIFLTHGHRYNVRAGVTELASAAAKAGAGIAVFGHTHIPLAEERYGVILLNPGSITEPRQEVRKPTYLVLEKEPGGKLQWEFKYTEQ